MKRLILAIVLVITWPLYPAPKALAFWDTLSVSANEASINITIGAWDFEEENLEWSPDINYEVGDVVFFEGQFWIRTEEGPSFSPGTNPPNRNFWDPLD